MDFDSDLDKLKVKPLNTINTKEQILEVIGDSTELNMGGHREVFNGDDEFWNNLPSALTDPRCRVTNYISFDETIGKELIAISKAISEGCNINTLHMESCETDGDEFKQFTEALENKNCKLTKVNISPSGNENKNMDKLRKAILNQTCAPEHKLQELNVGISTLFNEYEDKEVAKWAEVLEDPRCGITKIFLQGNDDVEEQVTLNEGAISLSRALMSPNFQLTELTLTDFFMENENFAQFTNALTSPNCKLTNLDLSGTRTSDAGFSSLIASLKHENCKIKTLNLSRCNISEVKTLELINALERGECRTITKFYFGDNSQISQETKERLENASHNLDIANNLLTLRSAQEVGRFSSSRPGTAIRKLPKDLTRYLKSFLKQSTEPVRN